jgi:hypothetical protein
MNFHGYVRASGVPFLKPSAYVPRAVLSDRAQRSIRAALLRFTKPEAQLVPRNCFSWIRKFGSRRGGVWLRCVIDISGGDDQWFLACRDGPSLRVLTLEGRAPWNELIPYPPRENSSNALWGLPIFHPRLHLASDGPILAVGA